MGLLLWRVLVTAKLEGDVFHWFTSWWKNNNNNDDNDKTTNKRDHDHTFCRISFIQLTPTILFLSPKSTNSKLDEAKNTTQHTKQKACSNLIFKSKQKRNTQSKSISRFLFHQVSAIHLQYTKTI